MATNNAAFVSQIRTDQLPMPTHIYEDLTPLVTVQITMRNTGDTIWVPPSLSAHPYRLGSQNPQDNMNWGTNRIDLTRPVSPGDEYTFSLTLDLSLKPNIYYNFQWRMVQ